MRARHIFFKVLIGIFILGIAFPGFSMFVGNYSEESFEEDDPEGQTMAVISAGASATIKDLISKSATYFLRGKANVDWLTSKLEAADREGVCFSELQTIVNDSLYNMKVARYYYQTLKNKADSTPYNKVVINQLINFDYDSFSREYSLNSDIYNQVKEYLKAGDVRGAYARFYTYIDSIVGILEMVLENVYCGDIPETANIWKLNHECTHMLLFGQYIAQTYFNLINSN